MKKLFLLVALMLGIASCKNEPEGLDVVVGNGQEAVLNVSLPESTRGESSSGFDFNNLGEYKVRYILEIEHNNEVVRDFRIVSSTNASFPVRLAPDRTYKFTVWADLVTKEAATNWYDADLYYNTANGLDKIEIQNWTPNVEARDAYTGKMEKRFVAGTDLSMELKRPFAKVRVVATDIEDVKKFNIVPDNANVTYSVDMYTKYDAVNDIASEAEAIQTINYPISDKAYDEKKGQLTVFADYFFVPENKTVQFSLDIKDDANLIKSNNFNTSILVEKNKITSIVGDVLTEGGNVSITVDSTIGEKETINYVDSATTLQEIINNTADSKSANITLGGDIDLNDLLTAGTLSTRAGEAAGLVIPANKTVVLDLKGFTISQSKTQTAAYSMIENNGTLTIINSADKNGTISYGDNAKLTSDVGYASNTIQNNGVLTINEGVTLLNTSGEEVASYGYPHVIDTNGTLTINGGTLTNQANYSTMRIWTSNTDAEKCAVEINGGTFNGCIDFQAHNNNYPTIPHYGTLTVNNGTFNADTFTKSAIRVLRFGVNAEDMHATINGGNFDGKVWVRNIGTFDSTPKIINIYGGKFTDNAKEGSYDALAEGYQFAQSGDCWTVAKSYEVEGTVATLYYGEGLKGFIATDNACTKVILANDITVNELLAVNKEFTIDLNGHTLTGVNTISDKNNDGKISSADNAYLFDVRGNLTVENGTIEFKHTGDNFGWNACSDAFYVAENGTLNVIDATVENLGGTDMAYAIDLVNAKDNLNLNITNSTIKSSYIPVRIFNNGAGVNNVTIKDSTLEGVSRALWVHIYSSKDNGGKGYKDATLNLDIFGNGNTYKASNEYRLIEFGFDDVINFDGEGNLVVRDESALEYAFTKGIDAIVGADVVTVTKPLVVANGKSVTLNLNGKSLVGESSTTGKNYDMIDVCGNLKVKNGTITCEFKGENMGWSASTNVFNITDGGVVELEGVTAKNLGGSDMAFVAHLNNWGEATFNAVNSTMESTYITLRAFNSGNDMNNISIYNSTLKGKYCFWVHNYKGAGDAVGTDETLNLDIINGTNIFEYSSKAPILYGFNEPLYFDAKGSPMIFDAAGLTAAIKAGGECTLGADIVMTESVAISDANFTLDGNGKTITMAEGATNTYALFDITRGKAAIKNITFDGIRSGAVVRTVGVEFTAENVTAKNGQHTQQQGLFRLIGKSTIKDCEFTNNTCSMVITLNYDGANSDPQVIENCLFEGNTCNGTAAVYYVKGAGATINGNKFIGNTVNCSGNGATVYMGFTEDNVVTNNLFQNNTVNEATDSSRVAGGIFFGYETEFTGNAFVGNRGTGSIAKANDVCVSTYFTNIDLSGNYWGGNAPVKDVNYFVQHEDRGYVVIINDYLTENPIK